MGPCSVRGRGGEVSNGLLGSKDASPPLTDKVVREAQPSSYNQVDSGINNVTDGIHSVQKLFVGEEAAR